MVDLLPSLVYLSQLPNSERLTFETALFLCERSFPDGWEEDWDPNCEDHQKPYEPLDDALVLAIMRLLKKDGFPDAFDQAALIVDKIEAAEGEGYERACVRSLQLLMEISHKRSSSMITQRALRSSPLPPEVVKMIEDALLEIHAPGLSQTSFVEAWETPRPCFPDQCPQTEPEDFSRCCDAKTCTSSTSTRWLPQERRWSFVHHGFSDNTRTRWSVGCARQDCKGHHDEDFGEYAKRSRKG